MKAKSWKTFADKEPKKKKAPLADDGFFEKASKANPLEEALEQNSTLKKLMTERQALEKKMGALTGQSDFGNFGNQIQEKLGEIPSISEKKKEINAWDANRKKALEALKKSQGNERQAPTGLSSLVNSSNATPLGTEIPTPRFAEKLTKKKDEFSGKKKEKQETFEKKVKEKVPSGLKRKKETFDKLSKKVKTVKKKKDDWLAKKEKLESKFKNAKKEVSRFNDSIDNLQKDLDRFGTESGGDTSDVPDLRGEISKVKDRFLTDSKVGKKMEKMTESFNKKRGGEKLDQKWAKAKDKVKNKYKELNRAKSKYEARRDKLLNVNKNTLEELDEKRSALKEQLSAKKKAEKREEERKAKRKEEQKAERDAERKEEEKRETKKEQRKRQKKERF
ncbi:MAG: hypothetical protein GQ574_21640 [Crocinitomix sp.]|nr:hypothetical protein [Crocinitomix sp.]